MEQVVTLAEVRRMKQWLKKPPPTNPESYDSWLEGIGDAWKDYEENKCKLPWWKRLFA
jgi:hypothetical protein